jgi:hypothetical protein
MAKGASGPFLHPDLCQTVGAVGGNREAAQEKVPEPLGRELPGHLRLIVLAHIPAAQPPPRQPWQGSQAGTATPAGRAADPH